MYLFVIFMFSPWLGLLALGGAVLLMILAWVNQRVPQLLVGARNGTGSVDLERVDSQTRVAVRMPSATADFLRSSYPGLNLQGDPTGAPCLPGCHPRSMPTGTAFTVPIIFMMFCWICTFPG